MVATSHLVVEPYENVYRTHSTAVSPWLNACLAQRYAPKQGNKINLCWPLAAGKFGEPGICSQECFAHVLCKVKLLPKVTVLLKKGLTSLLKFLMPAMYYLRNLKINNIENCCYIVIWNIFYENSKLAVTKKCRSHLSEQNDHPALRKTGGSPLTIHSAIILFAFVKA